MQAFQSEVIFNQPPFLLGAYDQIASYSVRAGAVKSFSVRLELCTAESRFVEAVFVSKKGQPHLETWRLCSGPISIEIDNSRAEGRIARFRSPNGQTEQAVDTVFGVMLQLYLLALDGFENTPLQVKNSVEFLTNSDWKALSEVHQGLSRAVGGPYAFAPIRTSPQRTYDPIRADRTPAGSHVPMALASLSESLSDRQSAALRKRLERFGGRSGLFDGIKVIRKGKKESDPFQIGIRTGGSTFNLTDVGYGGIPAATWKGWPPVKYIRCVALLRQRPLLPQNRSKVPAVSESEFDSKQQCNR